LAVRINLEPTTDQSHSFAHAGNADTKFDMGPGFLFLIRHDAMAKVANFQREI
jgi:hypothetical protein